MLYSKVGCTETNIITVCEFIRKAVTIVSRSTCNIKHNVDNCSLIPVNYCHTLHLYELSQIVFQLWLKSNNAPTVEPVCNEMLSHRIYKGWHNTPVYTRFSKNEMQWYLFAIDCILSLVKKTDIALTHGYSESWIS